MRQGRSVRRTVLLALAGLLAAGCSAASAPTSPKPPPPPASAAGVAGTLDWRPCERGFECAALSVPLRSGRMTDLAVTRHRATGQRVGSLVVNPGGPGAGAVDSLQRSSGSLTAALREHFDLVAFDPRGVGRSSPVSCGSTAEIDAYFALDPSPDTPAGLAAYEAGSAALAMGCQRESGALLPEVSTVDVAADLERLRAALGDERLTYLGYSYGTAIGAAYLDAYPTRVRTMVLDGALDPTLSWDALLAGQSRGFDAALLALLTDCERTGCAFRQAVTGDLGAAYDALAARIEVAPLATTGSRTVGPGELTLAVGAGLYDRAAGWPAVAAALAAGQRGDGRALLALSDGYLERTAAGYDPLISANTAVNCVDRPWPRDPQAYVDLAGRVRTDSPRFGPAIALSGLPCATWPVPATSTPHPVHAPGAPPVVVVGTTGDPATPYAWAVALAGQLQSGVLVTHRGDGHTVYRAGAPRCLTDPLDTYLVTGLAPPALIC